MWRYACAVALICAALAVEEPFKRAEMSASPFVLSTRYGRSLPRMLASRSDRFFMNGRYGKRSEPEEQYDVIDSFRNERERDRDIGREEDRKILQKWRPKCDCTPYNKQYGMKNDYYKRTPEAWNQAAEDD